MPIRKMAEIKEDFLKKPVDDAFITVYHEMKY